MQLSYATITCTAVMAFVLLFSVNSSSGSEDVAKPKEIEWHFDGFNGTFDRRSIQRGFKVFREVCSACHSVHRVAFRNLREIGFSEEEVKALALEYSVQDGPNDEGEMFERPATPADRIPGPYANDKAAKAANNGALPPDLSLIIKAREHGANYVYSLLTGYSDPPENFHLGENMHYNPYFSGGGSKLAMTPPLTSDGQVAYTDGTDPTVEQMAKDVVNFLQWAAEPEMEHRKGLGIKVIIFLSVFTLLFYFAKRSIWRKVQQFMQHFVNVLRFCVLFCRFCASGILPSIVLYKLAGNSARNTRIAASVGKKLAALLPRLGPAFVKLAQAIATRPDIIGTEISKELESLQDRLPPHNFKTILSLINAEFGCGHFKYIEPAIAAASIAEVHKVETQDGELIALKILRPGIEKKFKANMSLLFTVAKVLDRLLAIKRLRLLAVAETIAKSTAMELDLRIEAAAADKIRSNLKNDQDVYIPKVFWAYTRQNILATEWIDGVSIHDKQKLLQQGLNPSAIAKKLATTFFNQAYRDGFFHADVHQGNILITPQEKVAFVDFGIMGQLEYLDKIFVAEILKSFLDRDYDQVAKLHIEAGYVPSNQSVQTFALACRSIGEPIFNQPIEQLSISQLLKQLFTITKQFDMETQPQLLLLQKTMVTVEGLSRYLDKHANMWILIAPWIKKWARENLGSKAFISKKINRYKKLLSYVEEICQMH